MEKFSAKKLTSTQQKEINGGAWGVCLNECRGTYRYAGNLRLTGGFNVTVGCQRCKNSNAAWFASRFGLSAIRITYNSSNRTCYFYRCS